MRGRPAPMHASSAGLAGMHDGSASGAHLPVGSRRRASVRRLARWRGRGTWGGAALRRRHAVQIEAHPRLLPLVRLCRPSYSSSHTISKHRLPSPWLSPQGCPGSWATTCERSRVEVLATSHSKHGGWPSRPRAWATLRRTGYGASPCIPLPMCSPARR